MLDLRSAVKPKDFDRKVGLHNKHGGAGHLGLLKDVAPLPVQDSWMPLGPVADTTSQQVNGLHGPGQAVSTQR